MKGSLFYLVIGDTKDKQLLKLIYKEGDSRFPAFLSRISTTTTTNAYKFRISLQPMDTTNTWPKFKYSLTKNYLPSVAVYYVMRYSVALTLRTSRHLVVLPGYSTEYFPF